MNTTNDAAERERIAQHDQRVTDLRERAEVRGWVVHVVPAGFLALRWGRCRRFATADELAAFVARLDGRHDA